MEKEEKDLEGKEMKDVKKQALINKKVVRKNKGMKLAQKEAKKRYGRVRMHAPKLRISKVVRLESEDVVSFCDEKDTKLEHTWNQNQSDANTFIQEIKKIDLKGFGGGAFPTAQKLQTLADSNAKDKYLIVNGVECEPGLLHDEWILKQQYDQVINGIQVLNTCFHFKQVYLASKMKKTHDLGAVQYVQVPNRYPMGEEKQLIKAAMNLEFTKSEIPAGKGVIVMNIQTVLFIGRYFTQENISMTRYLTAADLTCGTAKIIEVPMGMNAKKVADSLFPGKRELYIGSGALSAHALTDDDIIDATTCFIGCGVGFAPAQNTRCKGCGACTANCPVGVDIRGIIHAMEKGKKDGFEQFHPEKCIGCGACSYVCMANKNTMAVIAGINNKDCHKN